MKRVYSQYLSVSFTHCYPQALRTLEAQTDLNCPDILTWCPHRGSISAQAWASGPFKSFLVSIPIFITVISLVSWVGIGPMLQLAWFPSVSLALFSLQ